MRIIIMRIVVQNYQLAFSILLLLIIPRAHGQETEYLGEEDHSYKPLILKLDDEGKKYIRFISWHQIWASDNNLAEDPSFRMVLRRSRFLTYAQISSRFLILTHFGLNTLTGANADPIGNRNTADSTINSPQLFMHGAWTEFRVSAGDQLYIGGGLHYWGGLSRLTSASTLNFMTQDNYRQAWASLGLSDQFARHLGVYAKGTLGKFQYTVAFNEPIENALGSADMADLGEGSVSYSGRRILGEDAGFVTAGYFEYQFLDQESKKLPYRVGTYLGKKRVFNIGAGFFSHANGSVRVENGLPEGEDVFHYSVDAFYDAPLGEGAINAYAAYYNFDYGTEYTLNVTYGTGTSFYGQLGYLFPKFSEKGRLMPYLAYSTRDYEAFDDPGNTLQLGANWFINGHHAKITLEYRSTLLNHTGEAPDRIDGLVLQTHIFL